MLKLWLIPKNLPSLSVSPKERQWANSLATKKKRISFIQEDILEKYLEIYLIITH